MIKYVCDEYLLIMCLREKGVKGGEIIFVSRRYFFYFVYVSRIFGWENFLVFRVYGMK